MSCCTDIYRACLVRGDTWTLDVGLSSEYAEVLENPQDWAMVIVMRESQDDDVTPYLTLNSTYEVPVDPLLDEPPILYSFVATSAETQALPEWDIVGYCELVQINSTIVSPIVKRLFNMEIEVSS